MFPTQTRAGRAARSGLTRYRRELRLVVARRIAAAVFISAISLGLGAAVPEYRHEMSDADKATLDRVSAYLNTIHTMKAAFVQIGPGSYRQRRFDGSGREQKTGHRRPLSHLVDAA